MKKHPLVLILLSFLVLTSLSCDKDDSDNPEEIKLTNENNFYEGDFYFLYLEQEITTTENTIDSLQTIIDNNEGTPAIEEELQLTEEQLLVYNTNLEEQKCIDQHYALPRKPRRPPNPPPPPSPCYGCTPLDGNFAYVTITPDIKSLYIRIENYNTEEVIETVSFDSFDPSKTYDALVSIESAKLNDFKGRVIIVVDRTGVNDVKTTYRLNAYLY
ncbi:hypothetical protein [Mesonia sp.]|uniref:hypothetical protein n=1 Tax=Mesonia sp. TaxID=1960830 RepID=UPI003F990160